MPEPRFEPQPASHEPIVVRPRILLAPTTQAGRLALSVFSVVALAPMAFVTTVFAEVLTRALSGPGPDAAGVAKKAA